MGSMGLDGVVFKNIHQLVMEQAKQWAKDGQTPVALAKVQLSNVMKTVHPRLWKIVSTLTSPASNKEPLVVTSSMKEQRGRDISLAYLFLQQWDMHATLLANIHCTCPWQTISTV